MYYVDLWKELISQEKYKKNKTQTDPQNARVTNIWIFSKWIDFRPIRWIRQNGQNHPCMN